MAEANRDGIRRSAYISECGLYRYELRRHWGFEGGSTVNFVMLNPSTADHTVDDPTVRRCIGFARDWGYDGLRVTNLYAFRATDPKELANVLDPVGPKNISCLMREASLAVEVVCAWGANAEPAHAREMFNYLKAMCPKVGALRLTKSGQPCHPLYLPKDLKPRKLLSV